MKKLDHEDARRRELLRVCEVAELLGESRANIYLRIKAGQIGAVRFGKTMRVHGPSLFENIDRLVQDARGHTAPEVPAA